MTKGTPKTSFKKAWQLIGMTLLFLIPFLIIGDMTKQLPDSDIITMARRLSFIGGVLCTIVMTFFIKATIEFLRIDVKDTTKRGE